MDAAVSRNSRLMASAAFEKIKDPLSALYSLGITKIYVLVMGSAG